MFHLELGLRLGVIGIRRPLVGSSTRAVRKRRSGSVVK
jgi:hypothetical protein